ncbi:MAG: sodium:solute symporter family protein [Firmicutes bacterium]|jgi:SSS family solute:Na+ symporter|nr:sodium:solute symporter family protein [Bacillota bacterium]
MQSLGIFIIAIIYVLVISVGIGIYMAKRKLGQSATSYYLADKSLGPWVGGLTIALASMGSLHTVGMMESGGTQGLVTFWMTVAGAGSAAVTAAFYAPYYRKLGFNTVPELFEKLFDSKSRFLSSILGIALAFAVVSLETQGGAIMLSAITGIDVRVALVVFMLCAGAYVMIAGNWQAAYTNVINMIVSYIVLIVAFIIVTMKLPGGWKGVDSFYLNQGLSDVLSFWPKDLGLLIGFGVALVVATCFCDAMDQGKIQYILGSRDVRGARTSNFIAVIFLSFVGFFTVSFGLAAMSIPEFAAHGPKMAGVTMLLSYLPTFVAGILLAAFLVIVLSTWVRFNMSISHILVNDFYMVYSRKPDAEKQKLVPVLSRVFIIIPALAALIPAFFMPHILLTGIFAFSLVAPLFVLMPIGLFWKRNSTAAFLTMVISTITLILWQYTSLPAILSMPAWLSPAFASLFISIIFGVVLTAILPGEKGLFAKERKGAAATVAENM